jgi:AcrR family transcriptional regulator
MSKPHDARAVRSRLALREAVLGLVENKPFEQISVKEIVEAAGVTYPVFYRRYTNKDELWADVATDEVRRLLEHTLELGTDTGLALCEFVAERRSLWSSLLASGASSVMRAEFARISIEIAARGPRANPWLPPELAAPFVAGGIFEILSWWLRQPESYPIARVALFLELLVIRTTSQPVELPAGLDAG